MKQQTATGYVLLRVQYDPQRHDLAGITARFEGGQGCATLTVCQVDDPAAVKSEHPFIAY